MLIADENIPPVIIAALRNIPVVVLSIKENHSGSPDESIIELAQRTGRIILTEDKDFGEWVFAHKTEGISVIFLRYHFTDLERMVAIITELLKDGVEKFFSKFTTVTIRKIRVRKI